MPFKQALTPLTAEDSYISSNVLLLKVLTCLANLCRENEQYRLNDCIKNLIKLAQVDFILVQSKHIKTFGGHLIKQSTSDWSFQFKNAYGTLFAQRQNSVVCVKHFINQSRVVVDADIRIMLFVCTVSLNYLSQINKIAAFKFSNEFCFILCF